MFLWIKKKNSTGPKRYIAKFLLNNLYGIFGRKVEEIQTIVVHERELESYGLNSVVKTMIPLKDENYILLIVKNLNKEITKKINCLVSLKGFKINQINQINIHYTFEKKKVKKKKKNYIKNFIIIKEVGLI